MMKLSRASSVFFWCLIFLFVFSVVATQASSPSPSSDQVTENLKSRLKESINVIESATAVTSVGYIGRVRDIIKNTLVIEDKSGERNIVVGPETTLLRSPGNTSIKLDNVKIDDAIIAIGIPEPEASDLQATRIIVSDTAFDPPRKVSGVGTVKSFAKNTLTLTGADGTEVVIKTNTKTVYKTPQETLDSPATEPGTEIVYTALVDSKDPRLLTATVIMQISAAAQVSDPPDPVSPRPTPRTSPLRPSPTP